VIFLLIIFYIHRISVYIWFWPTLEMCVPYARAARVCRVVPIKYAKAPDKKGWPEPYIYTPYMTVYLVISLPKIPYTHRIYMVLANPTYMVLANHTHMCITGVKMSLCTGPPRCSTAHKIAVECKCVCVNYQVKLARHV
jgi:hypothetical protein